MYFQNTQKQDIRKFVNNIDIKDIDDCFCGFILRYSFHSLSLQCTAYSTISCCKSEVGSLVKIEFPYECSSLLLQTWSACSARQEKAVLGTSPFLFEKPTYYIHQKSWQIAESASVSATIHKSLKIEAKKGMQQRHLIKFVSPSLIMATLEVMLKEEGSFPYE